MPLRSPDVIHPDSLDRLPGLVRGGYSGNAVKAHVWWPAAGVMVSRVVGHLDGHAARFLARSLRERMAEFPTMRMVGFHDWAHLSDYDSDARILLTSVAREALPLSDGTHLLVESPLVAFGIRAASAILRNVFTHSARGPFDVALAAALQRGALPPDSVRHVRRETCRTCGVESPLEAHPPHGWRLSRASESDPPAWSCEGCLRPRS